ncbi:hypothetical protein HLH17_11645 [Acinetobacter sp. ANC 5380]|uniref:Uncharacterized protein n=1 Tax=Acinetobacter terrae TaxID=2731247 RepID=A0A7Y2RH22_9GAMM|nr:hypothetical protein [Acinetobacter terrae]NNH78311.1 hypothetical protein [Acinetobacter terrae]
MVLVDDKKFSLIAKLIISYLLLLDFVILFYVFNTDPASDQTARGAVFTNLLVWSATIFTPIAAYFFYDSWKDQKNYELQKELMMKLSELVSTQFLKIMKYARRADRLKEIENSEIIIPNFSEAKYCYDTDLLNEIFAVLKIYEGFSNDESLKPYKDKFDNHAFELTRFLKKIENKYSAYTSILEIVPESDMTQTKTYQPGRKQKVRGEIWSIRYIMESETEFENTDINGNINRYKITYDKAHDDFEQSYNDLIKAITNKMKA